MKQPENDRREDGDGKKEVFSVSCAVASGGALGREQEIGRRRDVERNGTFLGPERTSSSCF